MHTTTIHVRWGELDPYNHVNHAVYSSYLEHARVAALEYADRGLDTLSDAGLQIVVVRSDVRFRAPATAGDELTITTKVAEVRGASMVWEQHIHRGDEAIVSAEITAAVLTGGRPSRIPDDLKAVLTVLG
ncbi:MAG: acyl-CoA thioesterase [Actinobacteria bacterium]|nr:acyl-CoA thioesterase [Actinomycetota bacterium]NIS29753.1 acyl-CoA thioesterase [Actinomycetota bacterium]NIU18326.1 acyl-CoA thioesterase [Actinomycetota bacterium]NIU65069.1 acyl-CoA thioesterase [Actinomycetota bacterium]NIW26868.1 YbgC/FadM family acyl-CoA thioesterase [Actinomycetota bacterium]